MYKPLELFIGLRYTRAKRRNHFISFISLISMLGIMLGVVALIAVLSVMNGFHKEVRERILGMTSHATISSYQNDLKEWEQAMHPIYRTPQCGGSGALYRSPDHADQWAEGERCNPSRYPSRV